MLLSQGLRGNVITMNHYYCEECESLGPPAIKRHWFRATETVCGVCGSERITPADWKIAREERVAVRSDLKFARESVSHYQEKIRRDQEWLRAQELQEPPTTQKRAEWLAKQTARVRENLAYSEQKLAQATGHLQILEAAVDKREALRQGNR